ncbi:MAG: hypothetical protein KAS39_07115, partial [Actinomycetia bacterium]|nr:hypothetical protein [Actinomycetes bacterium]
MPFVKDIMLDVKKPYLMLQFDGHGADAGYLTRIEAALESFKTFKPAADFKGRHFVKRCTYLKDKTILVPPMEPVGVHFFAAALRAYGYDARPMEENADAFEMGLKHMSGNECVPYPVILGDILYNVEKMNLDPNKCAFFIPTASGPCRLGQYVRLYDIIFNKMGWKGAAYFTPSAVDGYKGVPLEAYKRIWLSLLTTEIFKKMELKLRPYEKVPGTVNAVKEKMKIYMTSEFEKKDWDFPKALDHVLNQYRKIDIHTDIVKPRVGIVGEIYVRNTPFINNDLIGFIEKNGGEAMLTSIIEWIVYRQVLNKMLATDDGFKPGEYIKAMISNRFFHKTESKYFGMADDIIQDRVEPGVDEIVKAGLKYVPLEFNGEVILTVGRGVLFITKNQAKAVVNVAPAFCMFGTIGTSL